MVALTKGNRNIPHALITQENKILRMKKTSDSKKELLFT